MHSESSEQMPFVLHLVNYQLVHFFFFSLLLFHNGLSVRLAPLQAQRNVAAALKPTNLFLTPNKGDISAQISSA